MKLCQVLAVLTGRKTQATETKTKLYHLIQKSELFSGMMKTYKPKDELGDMFPSESKELQVKVNDMIGQFSTELAGLIDLVATQDVANRSAVADIVVDGVTLFKSVPVTFLLFLEKQLVDLATFVGKLPTLSPTERWSFNQAQNCYSSEASQSLKTKKVPRALVKYEATEQHPAQVETYNEDVVIGTWTTVNFSGAIPVSERDMILDRIKKVLNAVKIAREEANGITVEEVVIGQKLMDFVFKK